MFRPRLVFLKRLDGIGDVLKSLERGKRSFIAPSSIPHPNGAFDGRIIVRDESILTYDGGPSVIEELKMLEKMLVEQSPAPMTLRDMYAEHLNGVVVSSDSHAP